MTTTELHERYGTLTKSGHYLEEPNPFHYNTIQWVGSNTVRINEESGCFDAFAIALADDKDINKLHSRFLIFRVPIAISFDILNGNISLREAFDKHSDSIVYIVEQSHYSSYPYDIMAFSRNDVPKMYVEELEKNKCKAQKPH